MLLSELRLFDAELPVEYYATHILSLDQVEDSSKGALQQSATHLNLFKIYQA